MILTASAFILAILVWTYAVWAYPVLGVPVCSPTHVPFCFAVFNSIATVLTGKILGAAVPLLLATIILGGVNKNNPNSKPNIFLILILVAGAALTWFPFAVISTGILLIGFFFSALWPLLIIVPVLVKADRIILRHRQWEWDKLHSEPEVLPEETP